MATVITRVRRQVRSITGDPVPSPDHFLMNESILEPQSIRSSTAVRYKTITRAKPSHWVHGTLTAVQWLVRVYSWVRGGETTTTTELRVPHTGLRGWLVAYATSVYQWEARMSEQLHIRDHTPGPIQLVFHTLYPHLFSDCHLGFLT